MGSPGLAAIEDMTGTGFTFNGYEITTVRLRIADTSGGELQAVFKTRGERLAYIRRIGAEGRRVLVLFLQNEPDQVAFLGVEEKPQETA